MEISLWYSLKPGTGAAAGHKSLVHITTPSCLRLDFTLSNKNFALIYYLSLHTTYIGRLTLVDLIVMLMSGEEYQLRNTSSPVIFSLSLSLPVLYVQIFSSP